MTYSFLPSVLGQGMVFGIAVDLLSCFPANCLMEAEIDCEVAVYCR
jgi:hypothetical protein